MLNVLSNCGKVSFRGPAVVIIMASGERAAMAGEGERERESLGVCILPKGAVCKDGAPGPRAGAVVAVAEEIGNIVRETTLCVDESRSAGSSGEGQGSSKIEYATRVSSQCSRLSSSHTLCRAHSAAYSEPFDAEPFDSDAEPLSAEPRSPANASPREPQRPPRLPASCQCYLKSRAHYNRFMSGSLLHEYGAEVMGFPDACLSNQCSDSPPHAHEDCSCRDCSGQCWGGPIKAFTSQRRPRDRDEGHRFCVETQPAPC